MVEEKPSEGLPEPAAASETETPEVETPRIRLARRIGCLFLVEFVLLAVLGLIAVGTIWPINDLLAGEGAANGNPLSWLAPALGLVAALHLAFVLALISARARLKRIPKDLPVERPEKHP